MPHDLDIDIVLADWPYEPGTISARIIHAADGRELLQMRVDLGVLQMEAEGRPDGAMPSGMTTYLDYLNACVLHEGPEFVMSPDQCTEVDRELMQFYHRRICLMALREFGRAVTDADHSLALMAFIEHHAPDPEWTATHQQYRPLILFHRTQAAALATLDRLGADAAIEAVNAGLEKLQPLFDDPEVQAIFDEEEMVGQLEQLRTWLREEFQVDRTLKEQLADAIAREQYELAARLRDQITRRQGR